MISQQPCQNITALIFNILKKIVCSFKNKIYFCSPIRIKVKEYNYD